MKKVVAVLVGVPDPGSIVYLDKEYAFDAIHGVDNDLAWYSAILRHAFLSLGDDYAPVVLRSPERTTVNHITSTLEHMATLLEPGGLFVTVFCGHGFQAPPVSWKLARNADGIDPTDDALDEIFAATDGGIVDDYFTTLWERLPQGARVVAIADTCCSDTILQAVVADLPATPRNVESVINRPNGVAPSRLFISASMTWQEALERPVLGETHGVLTRALMESWRDGATYSEWFNRAARALDSEPQNPRMRYVGPPPSLLDHVVFAS